LNIRPTGNLVIVKPILPQGQRSAIVIPDAYSQERIHAVVLATGPGRYTKKSVRIPVEVEIGEIVYIGKNPLDAQQVKLDGEMLLLVPETSLLGKITNLE
jgi:co-chaperonin GroES (HSP10)